MIVLAAMALGGLLVLLGVAVGCNVAQRGTAFSSRRRAGWGDGA